MTGSEASSRSRLNACRNNPSKAKPKTTLFGSNLEKLDPGQLQLTAEMDLDAIEESCKPKTQVRNPPPVIAAEIKDTSKLAAAREELEARRRDLKEANKRLDSLEKHILYHPGQYDTDIPSPRSLPIPDKPHQWMNARDLAYASAINVMGVNPDKTESYNRDKYEARPRVHNYNLNGDPMNKGTRRDPSRYDYAARNKSSQIDTLQSDHDQKMYVSNYDTHYGTKVKKTEQESNLPVQLPRNIEHMFGSRVCRELLSDNDKVTTTLEEQARHRAQSRREKTPVVKTPVREKATAFEGLCNALRYDHFPGYSVNYSGSTTKDVFTEDVHKNHTSGPDQYRYKRDDLSTWAESNVLRDRMKKAWDMRREEILASKKA